MTSHSHNLSAHDDGGRTHNGSLIRLIITSRCCLLAALPDLSMSTAGLDFCHKFLFLRESTDTGLCARQSGILYLDHHWSIGRCQSMLAHWAVIASSAYSQSAPSHIPFARFIAVTSSGPLLLRKPVHCSFCTTLVPLRPSSIDHMLESLSGRCSMSLRKTEFIYLGIIVAGCLGSVSEDLCTLCSSA